jgi:hypothetical protein
LILACPASTGRAEHYAVIFAGGGDQSDNHPRYYDSVSRIHDAFLRDFNVLGGNIFVLAADGLDPAPDINGGGSSDWDFITSTGGTIEAATHDNMQNRLADLATILQPRDTLLVWTYDHGGGVEGDPSVMGEESLTCWSVPGQSGVIRDDELANWLAPIQADRQAYFFGQCFSGGMLDDLVSAGIVTDDGGGRLERFGCAAATHYETSVWSYSDDPHHYIDAVQKAIRSHGKTTTFDVEQWAYDHTHNAIGRGPGGAWEDGKQHPWFEGEDFELAVAHWYGTNSGNWSDSSDWKAGVLPEVEGRPVRIAGPHVCHVIGGTHTANIPLMTTLDGGQIDIESGAVMEVHQMDNHGKIRVLDGDFEVATLLHGDDTGEIEVHNDGTFHASWGRDYLGSVLVAGGAFTINADYTGGGNNLTVHSGGSFDVGQDMLLGDGTNLDVNQTGTTADIGRDMALSGSVRVRSGGQLAVGRDCTLGADGATDVEVDYGVMTVADHFELRAGALSMRGDPATAYLTADYVELGETGNTTVTMNGGRIDASHQRFATEAGFTCDITMDESGCLQPQIVSDSSSGFVVFGQSGDAHVVQNAGLVGNEETAANHPDFTLAAGDWSTSTYELNDGSVFVDNMVIASSGDGVFTQNGGVVKVFDELKLGHNADGTGVYNLRGGDMIVHGFSTTSVGSGTINIDGGVLMLPGSAVTVQNLNIGSAAGHAGEFFLGPRALNCENLRVGVNAGGVLTATSGNEINASGEIQVGVDHMDARVDQQGGAVTTPTITIGVEDDGWGEWNMDGGTVATTLLTVGYQGWGQFNQDGGATVEAATVNIGHFSNTGNNIYTLNDGELAVTGDLRLGLASGSSGVFRLRGANDSDLVTTTNTELGIAGEGRFEQSGGRHEVAEQLKVGSGGEGHYLQTGGSLATTATVVGLHGSGVFDQSGGIHEATTVYVGNHGTGEYHLSGAGQLSCLTLFLGRYDDPGDLNQTGGSVSVTGDYFVGHSSTALSTAAQTAGASTVGGNLIVGLNDGSLGEFILGGDSAVEIRQDVAGDVVLGYYTGSNGAYTIGGRGIYTAELHVDGDIVVGREGVGEFAMAGGRVVGAGGGAMTIAAGSTLRGDGSLDIPVVNHGLIVADSAYPLQFQQVLTSYGEMRIEEISEYVFASVDLWTGATFEGHVTNDGRLQVYGSDDVYLNGGMSGSGEVVTGSGAFYINSALSAKTIKIGGPFHAADNITAEEMTV